MGDIEQVGLCGYAEANSEQRYFESLPAGGNNIDFAGFHIDRFALQVDALTFTVSNGWTDATWSFQLFVMDDSPCIVRPPQTQTAEAGSTIRLQVIADGFPALRYQWFFNRTTALNDGTNSFLILPNVQPSQAGVYAVVVTNLSGAVTSAPAMLSVIPPVPRKTVPAIYLAGDAGSILHLDAAHALGSGAYWQPLGTVTLTNTPRVYLDLGDPLPSAQYYRAWQTDVPTARPVLDVSLATDIALTGEIGSNVRIDYINQIGPTDTWVTLDTVTLTNTTEPYFDLTMFRQPPRLYRLMRVP